MATVHGAMAAGFTTQSDRASFMSDGVTTDAPVGIILDPSPTTGRDGSAFSQYVVKIAAGNATAHRLCITEQTTVLGRTFTLAITSDDDAIKVDGVTASLHSVDTALSALGELKLNESAADISVAGESMGGLVGEVGIEAEGARLGQVRGSIKAAHLNTAGISDFHAKVVPGTAHCEM